MAYISCVSMQKQNCWGCCIFCVGFNSTIIFWNIWIFGVISRLRLTIARMRRYGNKKHVKSRSISTPNIEITIMLIHTVLFFIAVRFKIISWIKKKEKLKAFWWKYLTECIYFQKTIQTWMARAQILWQLQADQDGTEVYLQHDTTNP